jgi:outer membrane receptor protein involved in Fe transport
MATSTSLLSRTQQTITLIMKKTSVMPGIKLPACLALATLLSHQALLAQTAPTTSTAPAQPPPSAADEEVIELSPFTITADKSNSYSALNTTSVTRFNAELARLPISADVFTEAFMDDVGATSLDQLVVSYGTGTGIGGTDAAGNADQVRAGDRAGNINIKIRGLDAGTPRINSFGQGSISDRFTTERVDLVRGPQSLLNGGAGGGGVVNLITKQARFRSKMAKIELRTDNEGSIRSVLDYGWGNRRVAIRGALMGENQKYSRLYLGSKNRGIYNQLAFQLTKDLTLRLEGTYLIADQTRPQNGEPISAPRVSITTPFAATLAEDPRNGESSRLLVAQGRMGDIAGGNWNFDNVDSVRGTYFSEERDTKRFEATVEYRVGKVGTLQLAAMYDKSDLERNDVTNDTNITRVVTPNTATNRLDVSWRYGFRPQIITEFFEREGMRANFAGEVSLFNDNMRNQYMVGIQYETVYNERRTNRYYLVNPATDQIAFNPTNIGDANIGRTLIPVQNFDLTNGPLGHTFERFARRIVGVDGNVYELAPAVFKDQVPPTPTNPLGARGPTSGVSFWDQTTYNYSNYIAISTDWFGDRFTTLAGYRYSQNENKRYQEPTQVKRQSFSEPNSLNLGFNFRLTKSLRPYYGFSTGFNPPSVLQFGPDGEVTKDSKAVGHEVGIKFDPKDSIFSGSIAAFKVVSDDEAISISTGLRQSINPPGINGERQPTQNWINVDRESEGLELSLTANPSSRWRSKLTLSVTDGTVKETKRYDVYYNDEFRVNGAGVITYADGSPVRVAPNPANNNVATSRTIDLTLAMINGTDLSTAAGANYTAQPDVVTGRITNANLRNVLVGNDPDRQGQGALTGNAGLPFSSIQYGLRSGTTAAQNEKARSVVVSQEGDPTSGYAKYSANWTNTYDLPGVLKGFTISNTIFWRDNDRLYSYFDAVGDRKVKYLPDSITANLMLRYRKEFGKYTWTSQINVENLFDQADLIYLPEETNGRITRVRYHFEPRTWSWSNSISF